LTDQGAAELTCGACNVNQLLHKNSNQKGFKLPVASDRFLSKVRNDMTIQNQQSKSWSRYWAQGGRDACFSGSDLAILQPLWRNFFSGLEPGSRVLDLATGKGAVLQTAAIVSSAQDKKFELVGVDYAEIPANITQGFQLVGNVTLEKLPFEGQSFDAVSSQFGFEYADQEQAFSEMMRVLAPSARFQMVIHMEQGAIASETRGRLNNLDALGGKEGLIALVEKLAKLEVKKGRDKAVVTNIHQELSKKAAEAFETVRQTIIGAEADDAAKHLFTFLGTLWAKRAGFEPNDVLAKAQEAGAELGAYQLRLQAMLEAAMSKEQIEGLAKLASEQGFTCEMSEVQSEASGAKSIAWCFSGNRTA
jgi:ubiquinone/menaquinone biosynthesis C-methylase UbiE